ncbi:MAG: ABC transporter permease [Mycobacteriales bacterium]
MTALTALPPPEPGPGRTRLSRRSAAGWLGMPVFLLVINGLLYAWVQRQELDSIEARVLNAPALRERVAEHVQLSLVSTALVIAVAVPLGILATRPSTRRASPVILALGNLGQAIPSFGLITLIVLTLGTGFRSIVIGLFAYSALPILRNTIVGLQQVDPSLTKAARGMGMGPLRVLRRVELPLAVPVVLAGIRTALIINVGTATLSTFFGVQALGYVIFQGIQLNRDVVLVTGAVLASSLALLADYLAGVVQDLLSPRGL